MQVSNAKIWRGDARLVMGSTGRRRRACGPSTSIFPTRGGKSGTRSAGCSPTSWWRKSYDALQPGGELRVASDVEEYFMLIQQTDRQPAAVRAANRPRAHDAPESALEYLTNFERKYRLEGRPIFRANYRLELTGSDV